MSDRMNDPTLNPSSPSFGPGNTDTSRSIGEEVKWRYPALNPAKPGGTSQSDWDAFEGGRNG